MRIWFGLILKIRRDEILSHPFILTPPVQRAACALPFGGVCPFKNPVSVASACRNAHDNATTEQIIFSCLNIISQTFLANQNRKSIDNFRIKNICNSRQSGYMYRQSFWIDRHSNCINSRSKQSFRVTHRQLCGTAHNTNG